MKVNKFVVLASSMVFGTVMLMVAAVIVIFVLSRSEAAPLEMGAQALNNPDVQQQQETSNTGLDFVYLHDERNQDLIRVSTVDGSTQTYDLALATDNTVFLSGMTFSNDGALVSYCYMERITDEQVTHRLVVRDIVAQQNRLELEIGRVPGCNIGVFNEDASQIAVGIVYNSQIERSMNFPNEPNWALRTFDVNTGAMIHDLNANSPQAPDYESMTERFWFSEGISAMPRALRFTDNEIFFIAYPFVGRDGPPAVPAHRWDLQSGSVTPMESLTNLSATILRETGEIVYATLNEAYPARSPMGPAPTTNEVRIDDGNSIRTIYRNTELVISWVTFINGGDQVAILLFDPAAFDQLGNLADNNPYRIVILNRDGSDGQVSTEFGWYNRAFGTDRGMMILNVDQGGAEGNNAQLIHYIDGEMSVIWTTALDPQRYLYLVWTPPMTVDENPQAFAEIQ